MLPDTPTARVLLVDDKPQNLVALEAILSNLHLSVVKAGSGEEALRCLLKDDFAVILLDVRMPVMDGLQTAALIHERERSRHTPIIFVTASGRDDDLVTRGYSLGAVDYIVKPIHPHILRSKVAVFVELFRKTAQVRQQAAQLASLNEDLEARVAARTVELQRTVKELRQQIAERKRAEAERAQLLVREQAARAEAEAAQRHLSFLAEASNVLAASLDYEATLTSLAHLVVPYFADWCGIDMVEADGSIRQLAVAHVDPSKVEWARELRHRYPIQPDAPRGVPHVLRTGQSEIYAEIPDSMLVASARDAAQLEILRRVGMKSVMLVPLVAHGRVLGVITFVAAESGRQYGPADLTLAEDFARRAALAVDNARLFATARKDARRKAALAALTAELAAAGEPRAVLERAVDAAAELLEAHTAAAFLCRADGRGFDAAAARGLAPLESGAPVLSRERSIAGRAVASRTVEAVEDAAPERAAGTVFPRLAGDVPVGAVLAAPIAEGATEPNCLLEVNTTAPRAWPDEDRELLRALAATCAVALRQRRLLATTQDDARRLAALNRVAEVVIGAPTFGAMCDRALAVLTEVLDAGAAAIHVYDETAPPDRALRMVSW